ncbi:distal tail protein Dit, partial [Streptococcus agalactiae]
MVDYKTVKAYFGDVELTKWITITDGFTIFNGADYDPDLKDIKSSDGSIFINTRAKHKVIKVPFWVKYNSVDDYDALQLALYSKKPKMLMFSHVPDRYFLATQVGDFNFKEIKMSGFGELTFIIADGYAHSTSYKRFKDYSQDGNKMTFKIKNNGTAHAFPIIRVKHLGENGYIGIANETGAFALGSPEEEDGTIVHRNEVLFDYSKEIAQALEGAPNVAKLNYMPPTFDSQLKRMRLDNILGSGKGGEYVVIGNRGTTPGYGEHVGTRTFTINPD